MKKLARYLSLLLVFLFVFTAGCTDGGAKALPLEKTSAEISQNETYIVDLGLEEAVAADSFTVTSSDTTLVEIKKGNGKFSVKGLKTGDCTLTIEVDGYKSTTFSLKVGAIRLLKTSASVMAEESYTLTYEKVNLPTANVTATLSDTTVASITKEEATSVTLKGLKRGNTTLTLASGGISSKFTFTVKQEGLEVEKTEVEVGVGDTVTVGYTQIDMDTTTQVEYEASKVGVADEFSSVDITGKLVGETVVKIKAGKFEQSIKVKVVDLILSEEQVEIGLDESYTFTYEKVGVTGEVAISENDTTFASYTHDKEQNSITVTSKKPGAYVLSITIGSTTRKFTAVVKSPEMNLSDEAVSVAKGRAVNVQALLSHVGNVEVTAVSNDTGVATVAVSGRTIIVTAVGVGNATVTVSCGDTRKAFDVTVTGTFKIYGNGSSTAYGEYATFYEALDALMVAERNNDTSFTRWQATIKNADDEPVFMNWMGYPYNYVTANGAYTDPLAIPENCQPKEGPITTGKSVWWSNYSEALGLYGSLENEIDYSMLIAKNYDVAAGDPNYGKFESALWNARPTGWVVTDVDWAHSYNGDPNGIWNGWRASVYKKGLSVAQFNGWASTDCGDRWVLEYDLSESTMVPSWNGNQTTSGELWIGGSYIFTGMFGVTFNAGSVADNENLADGTTRAWNVYYEDIGWEGGFPTEKGGERTMLEDGALGNAVWNATAKQWELEGKMKLDLKKTWNTDGKMEMIFVATYTDGEGNTTSKTQTFTTNVTTATGDYNHYRLNYGVNYTPVKKAGREVSDLGNGGSWLGVVQCSAKSYEGRALHHDNIGFLASRLVSDAKYVTVYGSDVCRISAVDEQVVLADKQNARSCYMTRIDFRY